MGAAAREHAYNDSVACAVCGAEWPRGLRDGVPVAEPAGTLLTGEGEGGWEGETARRG